MQSARLQTTGKDFVADRKPRGKLKRLPTNLAKLDRLFENVTGSGRFQISMGLTV